MILSVLPDELRLPLAEPYADVVAVVRPLDAEEKGKWFDAFPDDKTRFEAAHVLVRQHLVALPGLQMQTSDGSLVPFDAKNIAHMRSLPLNLVGQIYNGLLERSNVSESLEKNSDSPSVSDGKKSGSDTDVETVVPKPETV